LGLALSLFFCGCRHQTESAPPLDSIRELLNQREYDQAISKLENYRKKQPDDQEATLLLATAYTGSTGVNLVDSYSFFSKILMEKPQNPRSAPGTRAKPGANPIDEMAQLIRKYLASLAKESDIFFAIPYVNQNQRSRLVEALLLLKAIPDEDSVAERARAYQGFLHLLQFSNYTKDMFPQVDFNGPVTVIDLVCTLNTQAFLNQMHYGLVYLTDLLSDAEWILIRKNRKLPVQLLELRTQVNDLKASFDTNFNPASQGTVLLESLKNGYCS
jgi:hypothetical protein